MKGRQQLSRRFSLQPPFKKDESGEKKPPKPPPRRPDRSLDRDSSNPARIKHRVVVMGAARTGKTAIISQFLYNTFTPRYKRTIEEMYHGDFEVGGAHLHLEILDTSGDNEFPAMRNLSIVHGEGFILVYDLTEPSTFEIVCALRQQIVETKGTEVVPIVVVGNKSDLAGTQLESELEPVRSTVTIEWEHGFVVSSAKENVNIAQIFKELLHKADVHYNLSPALDRKRGQSLSPAGGPGTSGTGPRGSPAGPSSRRGTRSSSSQTHHSRRRRERESGTKRNPCILS